MWENIIVIRLVNNWAWFIRTLAFESIMFVDLLELRLENWK